MDGAKLAAHAANEARHYAEIRVAELEHALKAMDARQQRYERQRMSQRLTVHVAGLTLALVVTLITLGAAIPDEVKFALPFAPSVALEVIDKYLRL